MKTLIIYKNNGDANKENSKIDIINTSMKNINDMYYACPKIYCYYLFIDYNIKNIIIPEIDEILTLILNIIDKYGAVDSPYLLPLQLNYV